MTAAFWFVAHAAKSATLPLSVRLIPKQKQAVDLLRRGRRRPLGCCD